MSGPDKAAVLALAERHAQIADKWADKHRKIAAECANWSAPQAEHMRAKDACMNIADEIRALAQQETIDEIP